MPSSRAAAPLIVGEAPVRCASCPIRERAVCSYCDGPELQALDKIKSYRSVASGGEILAAGEDVHFVGSIVSGVVKLTKTLVDGRRQMVGLLFPSDFVGRSTARRSDCDAVAATDVTLCTFDRRSFDQILRNTPNLEHRLLEMTLDELDATREWLVLLGRKSAREKVASFLCLLARRTAPPSRSAEREALEDGNVSVQIPLTREDMADYLGLTIETVSRQMSALKKEGLIRLIDARDIEITDLAQLIELSGEDSEGGIVP